MIELVLNNRQLNVGYMEYNIMRELNVNEIEQVNGGWFWAFIGGWIGGHAMDSAIENWRGATSYREFGDTRLAP